MPLQEHLLSPAKPQKAAGKNGRRKLAVSALISLSSIMVSADVLANAGKDTGDGVTPTGTQTGGTGWIVIGTDATATLTTNVDGASAAMELSRLRDGKWSTAIGSYSDSSGDSSPALGVKASSTGNQYLLRWAPHLQPRKLFQWRTGC